MAPKDDFHCWLMDLSCNVMQAECSVQAESVAAEIAAKEAELAAGQKEQADNLAKQDALAREILEAEKRLQVQHVLFADCKYAR